jgi:hypothetical protein
MATMMRHTYPRHIDPMLPPPFHFDDVTVVILYWRMRSSASFFEKLEQVTFAMLAIA